MQSLKDFVDDVDINIIPPATSFTFQLFNFRSFISNANMESMQISWLGARRVLHNI
jgi:hypothetical protein